MAREHPRLVKLVRDGVGKFLGDTRVSYRPVSRVDHHRLLKEKLMEEAVEYVLDPSLGELADVYETLRALAKFHGTTIAGVVEEAAHKRAERGGFDEGTGMYATSTADARHEGEHGVPDA